ncbi:MAG: carboxypeptidase-like regulatory domain-containing protein [archaeon]|nr:carboxypeptidase-like regulatory domain-containing protein [archaeon]
MEANMETIMIMIGVIALVVFIMYVYTSSGGEKDIVDKLTVQSTKIALFNNLLAAPCLNNDYKSRVEMRKFIMDAKRLDEESSTPLLSCMNLGNSKYRIDIKDLDSNNRWTFSNYQPITPRAMDADFEMIVQVNANSIPGSDVLDQYHKAILTANIELDLETDKLQHEMFCDEGSEGKTITDGAEPDINCIYHYTTNDCETGNCIKGPGQANATCQLEYCTYDKEVDAECITDCECKTVNCVKSADDKYKCTGMIPPKLMLGQPCKNNGNCLSDICAINKRCAKDLEFAQLTGKVRDRKTDSPIEGATVEVTIPTVSPDPSYIMKDNSDELGDYQIQNIECQPGKDKMSVKVIAKKDGYFDEQVIHITLKRGQTKITNIRMRPN